MLKMFGIGKAPSTAPSTAPAASPQTTLQRERVRSALQDTLQKHGLPTGWITCDVLPKAADAANTLVLLTVVKWHGALMDYAPALEQELLKAIDRVDTATIPAGYTFAWKFAPDCGCPQTAMPRPDVWSKPAQKTVVAHEEAKAELHKKFDKIHSEYDHRSSGFAPTEPGPLR